MGNPAATATEGVSAPTNGVEKKLFGPERGMWFVNPFIHSENKPESAKNAHFWNYDEYITNQKAFPTLCEWFNKTELPHATTNYRVFIDVDTYVRTAEQPDVSEVIAVAKQLRKDLRACFINTDVELKCAWRETAWIEENEAWKVSLRVFANGVYATLPEMATAFDGWQPDLGSYPDFFREAMQGIAFVDRSVYDDNKKLNCVGKYKGKVKKGKEYKVDLRILKPMPFDEDAEPFEFLVQHVDDTDERAIFSEEMRRVQKKLKLSKDNNAAVAGVEDPVAQKLRNTITDLFSLRAGDLGKAIDYADGRMVVKMESPYCLLRKKEHSSNRGYFIVGKDRITYKCPSEKYDECQKRIVRDMDGTMQQAVAGIHEERIQKLAGTVVDTSEMDFGVIQKMVTSRADADAIVGYLNNWWAKLTHQQEVFFCNRDSAATTWLRRKKANMKMAVEHLTVTLPKRQSKKKKKGKKKAEAEPESDNDEEDDEGPTIGLFQLWCTHPKIRTFKWLKFDPSHDGDVGAEYLNLWRGWPLQVVEHVDMGKIEPILYHMRGVLAAGNEEFHQYQLYWCVHIVQKPWVKTEVALLYTSMEGTGKNLFWEFFGKKIIGKEQYVYVNRRDHLTRSFNAHSMAKILTFGDECTVGEDKEASNILKALITQTEGLVEPKGFDPIPIDDYNNYVFASQSQRAIRADTDKGPRRFAATEVSPIKKGDFQYFEDLVACFTDPDTPAAFFTYLKRLDISSSFNTRKIPITQASKNLMEEWKHPIQQFVHYRILRGYSKHIHVGRINNNVHYASVQNEFDSFQRASPNNPRENEHWFTRDLNRFLMLAGVPEPTLAVKNRSTGPRNVIDLSNFGLE